MPPKFECALPFKNYRRLRVEGEIADVPVRGAWMPVGNGRRYFIVSPDIETNTDLDVGDEVETRFRTYDQDHVDTSSALLAALKSDNAVLVRWEKLTAGTKGMFTNHVFSVKSPATEHRRIHEAIAAIKEGIRLRDPQKRKA